jgi:hypothetical protein
MSLNLPTYSISDARKAAGKITASKSFSGDAQQWKLWKLLFTSSLDGAGYELSTVLTTHTIGCSTPTTAELDAHIIVAKAVFNQLLKTLSENDQMLIMALPGWTAGDASITAVKDEKTGVIITEYKTDKVLTERAHPFAAWSKLIERYEPNTAAHVRRVLDQLQQQTMGDDFDAHIAKLELLWAQLTAMGETISERMRLHRLLSSLPSWAEPIVSKIDSDDTASYKTALTHLKAFFARHSAIETDYSSSALTTGMFTHKTPVGAQNRGGKNNETCAHCHKPGHNAQNCWSLHPELLNKQASAVRNPARPHSVQGPQCGYCLRTGHTESECRTKIKAQQLRQQNAEAKTTSARQVAADSDPTEQVDTLTALPINVSETTATEANATSARHVATTSAHQVAADSDPTEQVDTLTALPVNVSETTATETKATSAHHVHNECTSSRR